MLLAGQGSSEAHLFVDGQWTTTLDIPVPANHMAAVQVGSLCFFIAGFPNDDTPETSVVRVFDFNDPTHFELRSPAPFATGSPSVCEYEGTVFLFGGVSADDTVSLCAEYNVESDTWQGPTDCMPIGLNHAAYGSAGDTCHIFSGR